MSSDHRHLIGGSLAIIAGSLILAGGIAYELDYWIDQDRAACFFCPTFFHPTRSGVFIGAIVFGVLLALAIMLLVHPDRARGLGAGIAVVSLLSVAAGDEFLVGAVLGILGGLISAMSRRGQPVPARSSESG